MSEREGFEAQQEAKRHAAGETGKATRERIWEGLTKYLAAEVRQVRKASHARKRSEQEGAHRRSR